MTELVNKPFHSATRRFKAGMEVSAADVAPLDFAHLKARGFIGKPSGEAVSAIAESPAVAASPAKSAKS